MSDPVRDRFDDLKYAYALGALTESERQEFEGYLAEHPELQAEVDDLGSVANLLALAPREYEPPPELRRDLLGRIGGSPGAPLVDSPPLWARLRGLFDAGGRAAVVVSAAAVLAVVGLLVWNVFLRSENEALQGELQEQQTYELQGKGPARDVRGEVVRVRADRAVLVAENLPPCRRAGSTRSGFCAAGFLSPPASSSHATGRSPPRPLRAPSTAPTPWRLLSSRPAAPRRQQPSPP